MSIFNRYILLILCFVAANGSAQEPGFILEGNLGTSITGPLRTFHNELTEQVNLENFKTTDNFYYNYGFTTGFTLDGVKSSFTYSNRVSGAKTSAADFSGYIRLTNELKSHIFTYKYYKSIYSPSEKYNLFLQFKGMLAYSQFNISSENSINGAIDEDSIDLNSLDFGVGTGLLCEYPVSFFVLRAYVDLDIYLGTKLKLNGNNDGAFLTYQSGGKVTTGLGGVTLGLGLTIPL